MNKFTQNLEKEAKEVMEQEIAEKANEITKANEDLVKDLKPNSIVETTTEVKNKNWQAYKDEEGNKCLPGGNKVVKIVRINNVNCLTIGYTEEERQEDEKDLRVKISLKDINLPRFMGLIYNNSWVSAVVNINGISTLTNGHTEEERKEDEIKARICWAKTTMGDIYTADDLVEAGLDPTKEFEKDGYRYIYFKDTKCARNFDGVKVADISDIKDKLSIETAIELLKARIVTPEEEYYCDRDSCNGCDYAGECRGYKEDDEDGYEAHNNNCNGNCDNCIYNK